MSRNTRLALAGGAALVVVIWVASGSFLLAMLVLVLVGGAAGLGVLALAGTRPRPEPITMATVDLARMPSPGSPVKRLLRRALARPWVRGDGLLRATAAKLASEDALVFTPRGQRVAAPHLWVEWSAVDAAEVAESWPLETLAREFADEYVERARTDGTRRLADRTWVHVLGREDVPVGRVVVTAAFSEPQDAPLAAASSTSTALAPAPVSRPRSPAAPQHRPPPLQPAAPPHPARPGDARPGDPAGTVAKAPFGTFKVAKDAFAAMIGGAAASGPRAALVSLAGGAEVTLRERPLVLGRDPHADVVLTDPGVSWQHLTVGPAGAPSVTDHGSTNGTFVDGRRVQGTTALRDGQEVAIGREGPRFRVVARDAAATTERTRQEAV